MLSLRIRILVLTVRILDSHTTLSLNHFEKITMSKLAALRFTASRSPQRCLSFNVFGAPLMLACWAAMGATALGQDAGGGSLAERIQRLRSTNSTEVSAKQESAPVVSPIYQQMLKGVVLLNCSDGQQSKMGTGWIIDAKQRLIVTNQHVIEGYEACEVYFPEYVDGRLVTDPQRSLVPQRAHRARIIDSSKQVDLALVQLDVELPAGSIALELADTSASPGEKIHSIAGSTVGTQSLWTYSTGHVRQVVRGLLANDAEAMVLESDMATNQGNSGGPVCNDRGEVVAVVEGHRTDARLVSIYVDLTSLVEYLDEALKCLDPQTVAELRNAAERHINEDRPAVGVRLVTKALKLEPTSAELFSLRGWCWYWLDDVDSCRADFQEALKLDPTLADAHSGLACVDFDLGNYAEAATHFTNAIRNDPDNPGHYLLRGKAKSELGDVVAAVSDFQAALQRNPESADAIHSLAIANIRLGNFEAGMQGLDATIDSFSEDPASYHYYALALTRLERYQESLDIYRAAIAKDPEYQAAYGGIGESLVKLEQYSEAIPMLSKAIELDDSDAYSHFFLGLSQVMTGNKDEGVVNLKQSAVLDSENLDIVETVEKILNDLGVASNSTGTETLVQTQQFSPQQLPAQYVGSWAARLQEDGTLVQMQLTIQQNGQYTMRITTVDPSGERNDVTDSGSLQIDGQRLTYHSAVSNEVKTHSMQMRNGQMLLFADEQDTWIAFNRYR